jgi:ElaB/YqjD/DUF883 family membrane-anchored ribosome-binding protein
MSPDAMKSINRIKESVSEIASRVKETGRGTSGVHHVAKFHQGDDRLTEFTRDIARKVGAAAGYLTRSDLNRISKDIVRLCRQFPSQSIATAMAVGFLIGRRRRS